MAKFLSCFNACAVGDVAMGDGAGQNPGASPAASADQLPIASLTELAPIYTLEGEGGRLRRRVLMHGMHARACVRVRTATIP